jgi:hypothetical protein
MPMGSVASTAFLSTAWGLNNQIPIGTGECLRQVVSLAILFFFLF